MTPKEAANALELALGILGEPRQLRDAIEAELLGIGRPAVVAAEQSEALLPKIRAELNRRIAEREAAGEIGIILLRAEDVIAGSSYVFADDDDDTVKNKNNRALAAEILKEILALTFSQFERFGSRILAEIGAHVSRFTRHAGDQGIDFYGEISVGRLMGVNLGAFRLMHDTKLVVVGQAKHYPTRTIGPNLIRELVGALSLSQTSTYSSDIIDLLDGVNLRPFTPLLAMLFSTGDFTRGARTLASKAGLITFSGSQLAVFLADKGVGIVVNDKKSTFSKDEFLNWLNS